ncbi:TetR/AcrR family transcriptional regulator [Solihabitans fulvus]|uniref:TetR/AcrR family transcriptional regulator n=1 Tax=Solihabitans fulvus TaxID=1892852 RepID=A0A5B2XI20_9PSEU|nr:TetR/AcrR family transcriptional regulator [Solihabitans fulvus]KAA2262372.1 TetR/AcrR family transcriptional regulator [Solihabitans fulvus]
MSEARRRLLDTASRLFYAEGIHTVGIDRIIAEAGVAKATFYHHFKAKDDLVIAYLTEEYGRQRVVFEAIEGSGTERIGAIFDMLGTASCGPGFRGCPFLNAATEFADPTHPVRGIVDDYRAWFRDFMGTLLTEAGRVEAAPTAEFLLVMRDGIAVSGMLNDVTAVRSGVATAMATI